MKRFVATIVLFCMLFACVSCGKEKDQNWKKVGTVDEKTETGIHEATASDVDAMNGSIPTVEPTAPSEDPTPAQTTDNPADDRHFVIALDPGHGGSYSGAVNGDMVEKELNLKLSLMIKEYLESNYSNVTVYMTRTDDTPMSSDLVEDLRLRVESAKKAGADIYMAIHFNASDNHDQYGSMICVSRAKNITDDCYALANSILAQLEPLGFKNNGPYQRNSNDTYDSDGNPVDYYAINRHGANNDLVAIIVENCFMDNEKDIVLFDSEEEMRAIAKADAVGAMNYLLGK